MPFKPFKPSRLELAFGGWGSGPPGGGAGRIGMLVMVWGWMKL